MYPTANWPTQKVNPTARFFTLARIDSSAHIISLQIEQSFSLSL